MELAEALVGGCSRGGGSRCKLPRMQQEQKESQGRQLQIQKVLRLQKRCGVRTTVLLLFVQQLVRVEPPCIRFFWLSIEQKQVLLDNTTFSFLCSSRPRASLHTELNGID